MKSTRMSSFLSRTGRLAAVLALAVCLAAGKDNTILSHAEASATVKAESAKIRSGADKGSDVVAGVKKDEKLSVTGEKTDSEGYTWYEVIVDGSTKGYIRADMVDKSGTIDKSGESLAKEEKPAKFTETSAEVISSSYTSGTVIPESVNVRKGPATTDAVVGSVKKGTAVNITGETDGSDGNKWFQISFSNNGSDATGFIRSDLLEPSGDAAAGADEEGTLAPEGEAAEGETGSEEGIPEEQPAAEPETGTEISNVVSSRIIPEGMDLSDMEIDAQTLESWQSGNYFLLYTKGTDGSDTWYLYDIAQGTSQKIDNLVSDGSEDGKEGIGLEGTGRLIVIILAALLIIMIIICTVLFLKLRSDRWDDEVDDDDEDEDDEEEEDDTRVRRSKWKPKNFIQEDDDDEEEEEEIPVRRPVKRPVSQQAPQKRPSPSSGSRPAGTAAVRKPAQPLRGDGAQRGAAPGNRTGEQPVRERQAAPRQAPPSRQQPAQNRPAPPKQRPAAAPTRQPEKQGTPVRQQPVQNRQTVPKQRPAAERPEAAVQKPAAKPVRKYQPVIDDEDEFEFGFLNMDGKDDL